jgi:hypothetical protein
MKVHIEFDSDTATQSDHQLLTRLVSALTDADWPTAEVTAPEAKKAPAKKAAAKKPEPEPEADEVVDAEIVEDETDDAEESADDLMEQAVQKATKLVSDGKAGDVKAALEKAGARRVSELKGADAIRKFLDAL